MTRLLASEGAAIQKEAAWCVINAVSGGNTAQIKYFVEHGAIKALCDLLVRADLMGPAQPLEALPNPNPNPSPSPSPSPNPNPTPTPTPTPHPNPGQALEYVLKHGKHAGESYMALVDIFKLKQLGEHADPEVARARG